MSTESTTPQPLVLRERQVQLNVSNASINPQPSNQAGEQALARLQAQRSKRAEQRLAATAKVPIAVHHGDTVWSPQVLGFNQHVAAGAPTTTNQQPHQANRRLRAKVTTTAGCGMQRQAPSRCSSSAACSVRASLDVQQPKTQQLQQHLGSHAQPSRATALTWSALPKAVGSARTAAVSRIPSYAGAGTAGASLLQVTGAAMGALQHHQQQQQERVRAGQQAAPTRRVSNTGLLPAPQCQPARLQAAVARTQGCVVSAVTAGLVPAVAMGCDVPWQQLWEAASGARAVQGQTGGSHLEHRRQVQQSRRVLAQLVGQQWRWFASTRRQQRLAVGLHRRRLTNAAWQGLSQEARRMQLLACRAQLQATKHSFMLLSRAFTSWQQLVALRRRLEAVTDTLQAHRHRQASLAVLLCWQEYVQHKRRKRQLLLRAEACYVFVTLLRVLQQWRARTTDKQLARIRAARADQHWQHAVYRHVLQCWQDKAARGAVKWQSLAKALCFNKQQLLSKAVQGWQEAMQQQQEARVAAEHAFQGVARHLELQGGADALWAWLEAAQLQGQRRQLLLEVAAARQQRTRQQVLQHWHQLAGYNKQLAVAAEALQQLQPAWWLAHSFVRWRAVAQVLAGQAGEELRELVQLRACLGTWLKYAERRRHKATRLSAAQAALGRLKLARLLPAWQEATAQQQLKRQQVQLAQEHYTVQLLGRMVTGWQEAASAAVVERLQLVAAAELHRLRLLAACWRGLVRYARYREAKAAAPEHYQHRLLLQAFSAWRDRTANKQLSEQQRRLAVRHCYLSRLRKVLQAWQLAMVAAGHKQQLDKVACGHHRRRLLISVLQAWRGPVLLQLREKHHQQAAADALARRHLLRRSLAAWTAAVAARRAKLAQQATALQHRQQVLLGKAMQGFLLLHEEAQQERQELAAAAAPAMRVLQQHRRRWVLRAWQGAVKEQQHEVALKHIADQHRRRWLLCRGVGQWRQFLAHRQRRAAQTQLAVQHHSMVLLTRSLAAFQQCVHSAAEKRRRVFAAALHRRSWLIWRAYRAWRLSAAVSHLERIVARPSSMTAPVTGLCSHSSRYHPQLQQAPQLHMSPLRQQQCSSAQGCAQDPSVVAAAVVEASCAAHRQWQEEWRSKWQHATLQQIPPHQPQNHPHQQQWQQWQQQVVQAPAPWLEPSTHHQAHPWTPAVDHQQVAYPDPASASAAAAAVSDSHPWQALSEGAAQHQAQHQGDSSGSIGNGSRPTTSSRRAARQQPRLPSFMLQEQQQQQQCQQPWQQQQQEQQHQQWQQQEQLWQPQQQEQLWQPQQQHHQQQRQHLELQPQQQLAGTGLESVSSYGLPTAGLAAVQHLHGPQPAGGHVAPAGQDWYSMPQPAASAHPQPQLMPAMAADIVGPGDMPGAAMDAAAAAGSSSRSMPPAATAASPGVLQLTWHSPQVTRRARPQPRQLRPSLLDTQGQQQQGLSTAPSQAAPGPDQGQQQGVLGVPEEAPWPSGDSLQAQRVGMCQWEMQPAGDVLNGTGAARHAGLQEAVGAAAVDDAVEQQPQVLVVHGHAGC